MVAKMSKPIVLTVSLECLAADALISPEEVPDILATLVLTGLIDSYYIKGQSVTITGNQHSDLFITLGSN